LVDSQKETKEIEDVEQHFDPFHVPPPKPNFSLVLIVVENTPMKIIKHGNGY
jgi:hypothetical protein